MHIDKACLRPFSFAAPIEEEYNPAVNSLASPKSTSITGCNTLSGKSTYTSVRITQFNPSFVSWSNHETH
jgi:hypothetical protein